MLPPCKTSSSWSAASTLLLVGLWTGAALAQTPAATPLDAGASVLQAKHSSLAPQLAQNQFQRPLVLESSESGQAVNGNAYAVINYPFATVNAAFQSPAHWCDVLMLHLNTKHCRANDERKPTGLKVSIGKKEAQAIKDAYPLAFDFKLTSTTPDYLAVQLNANQGPLGTHNYRIKLQAVPIAGGKTFMHLQYSYSFGMAGRLAMQAYLSTLGSGKVGFTELPGPSGGPKSYVDGMRGTIERNTMRYYLAIDAYLASLAVPSENQLENRLQNWFDATERYPLQLHEIERTAYLTMKRDEYQRQQTLR